MRVDLLPIESQLAFLVMQVYERQRRERQSGYFCFRVLDDDIVNSSIFKQFRTVAAWLTELGFDIRWAQVHWIGYIENIFREFKDNVPQPGQLKNNFLMKRYLSTASNVADEQIRSREDLARIYKKVLRPELLNNDLILREIGLRSVKVASTD